LRPTDLPPSFRGVLERIHRHHLVGVDGTRELWLVRHADAYTQLEGPDFPLDPPLSRRGQQEAAQLAERLRHARFGAAYSSPLRRALETGQQVLANHPQLRLQVDDRLGEVRTHWEEGDGLARIRRGRYPFAEPEGEVVARAELALAAIAARLGAGERALIFTHSGWIAIYIAHLLGLSFTRFHWLPRFTSVSVVVTDQERYVVRSMGDSTHLEPAEFSAPEPNS